MQTETLNSHYKDRKLIHLVQFRLPMIDHQKSQNSLRRPSTLTWTKNSLNRAGVSSPPCGRQAPPPNPSTLPLPTVSRRAAARAGRRDSARPQGRRRRFLLASVERGGRGRLGLLEWFAGMGCCPRRRVVDWSDPALPWPDLGSHGGATSYGGRMGAGPAAAGPGW
jgi:hypothetical protein